MILALFSAPAAFSAENVAYFDTFFGQAAVSPGTSTPWATVKFKDVSPGTVLLTISNSAALSTGAKLAEMNVNFNPSLNLSNLSFSISATSGGFDPATISRGQNTFTSGGDGIYDIHFAFNTGMDGGHTFTAGEYVTYQVTGIAGLTIADFAYLSAPGGGAAGPFYAVGHLLGLGNNANKSAWIAPGGGLSPIAVPEPGTALLFGLGMGVFLLKQSVRGKK
jgi:hypothetical protein